MSETWTIKIVNSETNEIEERNLSKDELDYRKTLDENIKQNHALVAAREEKLDSAITKLKALGLTESEAKIIIGLE